MENPAFKKVVEQAKQRQASGEFGEKPQPTPIDIFKTRLLERVQQHGIETAELLRDHGVEPDIPATAVLERGESKQGWIRANIVVKPEVTEDRMVWKLFSNSRWTESSNRRSDSYQYFVGLALDADGNLYQYEHSADRPPTTYGLRMTPLTSFDELVGIAKIGNQRSYLHNDVDWQQWITGTFEQELDGQFAQFVGKTINLQNE